MAIAPSMISVKKQIQNAPQEVREYFPDLPSLIDHKYSAYVCISYIFCRIEYAHRMTLYCGIVKKYRVNPTLTRKAVDDHYLERKEFHRCFNMIFGQQIPKDILSELSIAEKARDRILHGQTCSDAEARNGIVSAIAYASKMNDLLYGLARFRPFGRLQGVFGAAKALAKEPSRWMLMGMGFFKDKKTPHDS